jgi:hypothetical protein
MLILVSHTLQHVFIILFLLKIQCRLHPHYDFYMPKYLYFIAAGVIKITNSKSKETSSGQPEAKRRREDNNEAEGAALQPARRGRVDQQWASERGRGEWRASWRARGHRGGHFGDSRGKYRAGRGRGGYY